MIKIYTDEFGDKYCKLSITIDIPINNYDDIDNNAVIDILSNMDRTDIGEIILNVAEPKNVVKVEDNIPPTPIVKINVESNNEQFIYNLEEAENELEKTFIKVIEEALKNNRNYTELYTRIKFTKNQLNLISNINEITIYYDEEKKKYDININ